MRKDLNNYMNMNIIKLYPLKILTVLPLSIYFFLDKWMQNQWKKYIAST